MRNDLSNAPAVLSALRRLLSAGSSGSAAAKAMARFAAKTSSLPLKNLEAWERAVRTELWAAEQAHSRASWWSWARPPLVATWLDLCSHDGRKREDALRVAAGGAPNALLVALALRRLNDWVPQVRSAARETLPQMAVNSKSQDVADALWSLLALWNTWVDGARR